MAALTVNESVRTANGIDISSAGMTAAAGGGDTFANTGKEVIVIENTSGAPITLTVVTPATVDGLAVADLTASVPATTGKLILGPFPVAWYNDQTLPGTPPVSGGNVNLTYSSATNVKVKIVRVTPVN